MQGGKSKYLTNGLFRELFAQVEFPGSKGEYNRVNCKPKFWERQSRGSRLSGGPSSPGTQCFIQVRVMNKQNGPRSRLAP